MEVKNSYSVNDERVTRITSVGSNEVKEAKDSHFFISELGKRTPIDTGFLPQGLRRYSQSGLHAQMVIEQPPAINRVFWSESEGDEEYEEFLIAQPYRIIIADFNDGNFLGARMFYSPYPIVHEEQQLYHANVSNLNCLGYNNGVGVGWLCLYLNEDTTSWTIAHKMQRVIERCSGLEGYNYRNMRQTDGIKLYKEVYQKPEFTWNPAVWEKKTEAEGIDWTLDPELWVPILVKDRDDQRAHNNNGIPLTLEMAINGTYKAYYHDPMPKKPVSIYRSNETPPDVFKDVFNTSYVKSKKTIQSNVHDESETVSDTSQSPDSSLNKSFNCVNCGGSFYYPANHTWDLVMEGHYYCEECWGVTDYQCVNCGDPAFAYNENGDPSCEGCI